MTTRLGAPLGIRKGKSTIKQRKLMKTLANTYGIKPIKIRKILKLLYNIDMKESSISTWTKYNYKVTRYEQNRNRYK